MPVCRINLGLIYTVQHLQQLYLYGTSSITSLWKPVKGLLNSVVFCHHWEFPCHTPSPRATGLHIARDQAWSSDLSSWGDEVVLEGEVQPASNITNYEF